MVAKVWSSVALAARFGPGVAMTPSIAGYIYGTD